MSAAVPTTTIRGTRMLPTIPRPATRVALALLGALLALATSTTAAHAAFGVESFGVTYSTTQAGGHPDVTVSFKTTHSVTQQGAVEPEGQLKDVTVDLPPGVIGDPAAIPQCADADLTRVSPPLNYPGDCSAESQVGTIQLVFVGWDDNFTNLEVRRTLLPVYNMVPSPGHPARLAFNFNGLLTVPVTIDIRSDGDYGVRASLRNLTNQMQVLGADMTLWGNPSAPAHDDVRYPCLSSSNPVSTGSCPAATRPVAFMTNPTQCDTELRAKIRVTSYQHDVAEAQTEPVKMTGCEDLWFEPEVSVKPTTSQPDSPVGLDVGIRVPQSDLAARKATPNLRDATITLPEGVAINPAAADGLEGCTDAQSGIGRTGAVSCPPASRIGSVEIDTPLLHDPLEGSVYVGAPASDDPASGRMFRVFLLAEGSGVDVRLEGALVPDPKTGRLTATFKDNPQLPFSELNVRLDGGPRAVLSTPMGCGTATTTATLRPWHGGAPVTSTSQFAVTGACGGPAFAPVFAAGSASTQAGAASTFAVNVKRDSGQQELSTIGLKLPPGLLGNIRSAELCAEPQAAAGTCGPGSRIGTATVTSGSGATPLPLKGQVFLTGPYGGAPFGLSVVVPAKAGPYDLGLVVVRAKITVDRKTAAISVASDPMPTILKGVPLRLRSVDIAVDRPGFTLAPTSCAPTSVAGEVRSAGGAVSPSSTRFAVGGCAALDYEPKLDLALSGKGQTTDGKHPALTARLTMPQGDANSRRVQVALPLSLALDPDNAQGLCEPSAAAADQCPAASIVGQASAVSILHVPLTGPVYFVRGERRSATGRVIRTLPKLYIPLKGQGVAIDLHARSDVEDDQLVTTFEEIPDAPISSFDLQIDGGKHGILVVSGADVCKDNQRVSADFLAHSRKAVVDEVTMATPSCSLRVLGSSHTPSRLRVKVGGLGAGRVVVRGNGLRRTSRSLAASTVATVSVPLSRSVQQRLRRGANVRVAVKVAFTPKGAKRARTMTKRLTIHGAKRKR